MRIPFKLPFVYQDDGEFVTVKSSADEDIVCMSNYSEDVLEAKYIFAALVKHSRKAGIVKVCRESSALSKKDFDCSVKSIEYS